MLNSSRLSSVKSECLDKLLFLLGLGSGCPCLSTFFPHDFLVEEVDERDDLEDGADEGTWDLEMEESEEERGSFGFGFGIAVQSCCLQTGRDDGEGDDEHGGGTMMVGKSIFCGEETYGRNGLFVDINVSCSNIGRLGVQLSFLTNLYPPQSFNFTINYYKNLVTNLTFLCQFLILKSLNLFYLLLIHLNNKIF